MKERPILFNGEMINALGNGKTQTRRVIKPQLPEEPTKYAGKRWGVIDGDFYYCGVKCPYGQVGDVLWVRETWMPQDEGICYRADGEKPSWVEDKWKPSIHMPRKLARIFLEIISTHAERVQDITEEDAKAEGAKAMHLDDLGQTWKTHKRGFQSLWDSINEKRGFGWDKNPWVWVVTFKKVRK